MKKKSAVEQFGFEEAYTWERFKVLRKRGFVNAYVWVSVHPQVARVLAIELVAGAG